MPKITSLLRRMMQNQEYREAVFTYIRAVDDIRNIEAHERNNRRREWEQNHQMNLVRGAHN